jgi:hypothetical protein
MILPPKILFCYVPDVEARAEQRQKPTLVVDARHRFGRIGYVGLSRLKNRGEGRLAIEWTLADICEVLAGLPAEYGLHVHPDIGGQSEYMGWIARLHRTRGEQKNYAEG